MTVPCQNCGATDYTVTMFTDCDKCNPDLSVERFMEQEKCEHKNQEPSRIVGMMKCLDCGMVGCNVFNRDEKYIELTEKQSKTILDLVANLHWDLVREMLDVWSNDKNSEQWDNEKIKRGQKVIDDLQEIESIVKGVPIK